MDGIVYTIYENLGYAAVGDNSGNKKNGVPDRTNCPANINILAKIEYQSKNYPVYNISDHAFHYCSGVQSISIPDGIKYIGFSAFDVMSVEISLLTIPESVIVLDSYAFGTNQIHEIHIGTKVQYIGKYGIFAKNPPLMKIIVDQRNPYICNDNQYALYSKDKSILYQASGYNETFVVPKSVKFIGYKAFDGFRTKTISVPKDVTFSNYSFYNLPYLTTLKLYSGVPNNVPELIVRCPALKYIIYNGNINAHYKFSKESDNIAQVFVNNIFYTKINEISTTFVNTYHYYSTCEFRRSTQRYIDFILVFIFFNS